MTRMMPLKQILVPVDFSEACWVALEWASSLGRAFDASIDLLHIWEPPALASSLEDVMSEQADSALKQLVKEARARGISVRAARAVPGSPRETIVAHAAQQGYDLIVIGRHGRSRLARALLGSVAERVVRLAPCPVLVAQPHDTD